MVDSQRTLCRAAGILAVLAALAGCGGSSSDSTSTPPSGGGSPPPEEIQGVATPPSVAVVTATNAT